MIKFGKFSMLLSAALVVSVAICAQAQSGEAVTGDDLDYAIRDASDYLNDNIPKGSKIVILNIESNSVNLSEYVIDELVANVVNDRNFSVVDRRQLEAIQSEQKFQMSGAVDDRDALAIGKFFGAQTIISGAMREIGGRYRLTIRALAVQTAQVQGQFNLNMPISETLAALANSDGISTVDWQSVTPAPAPAVSSPVYEESPQASASPQWESREEYPKMAGEPGGSYVSNIRESDERRVLPQEVKPAGWSGRTALGVELSPFVSNIDPIFTFGGGIYATIETFKRSASFFRIGLGIVSYGLFIDDDVLEVIARNINESRGGYETITSDDIKTSSYAIRPEIFIKLCPVDAFYVSAGFGVGYYEAGTKDNSSWGYEGEKLTPRYILPEISSGLGLIVYNNYMFGAKYHYLPIIKREYNYGGNGYNGHDGGGSANDSSSWYIAFFFAWMFQGK